MKVKLRQTGTSLAVTVPKLYVDTFKLEAGDEIEIDWGIVFVNESLELQRELMSFSLDVFKERKEMTDSMRNMLADVLPEPVLRAKREQIMREMKTPEVEEMEELSINVGIIGSDKFTRWPPSDEIELKPFDGIKIMNRSASKNIYLMIDDDKKRIVIPPNELDVINTEICRYIYLSCNKQKSKVLKDGSEDEYTVIETCDTIVDIPKVTLFRKKQDIKFVESKYDLHWLGDNHKHFECDEVIYEVSSVGKQLFYCKKCEKYVIPFECDMCKGKKWAILEEGDALAKECTKCDGMGKLFKNGSFYKTNDVEEVVIEFNSDEYTRWPPEQDIDKPFDSIEIRNRSATGNVYLTIDGDNKTYSCIPGEVREIPVKIFKFIELKNEKGKDEARVTLFRES